VSAAAVVLGGTEHDDPARLRLDAYVVLADGGAPDDLCRRLRQMLPDYMVPSTITAVPALPLTVNGKLDVARLPAPQRATNVASAKADSGPVAGKVLSAWRLVLGPQVGGDDDFFQLGGNSLIAVRLAAALRDAGLPRVALRDLYLHPTPNRLAAALFASLLSEATS
jgi:Phosphopantetheine attachment site/AMP-binding enzyme C-terminal domain